MLLFWLRSRSGEAAETPTALTLTPEDTTSLDLVEEGS